MTLIPHARELGVSAVDRHVVIDVEAPAARAALQALCASMLQRPRVEAVGRVSVTGVGDRYAVRESGHPWVEGTLSDALWGVRYLLVHLLMRARPDLVFLHAAGVVGDERAVLLVGSSGSGKSTLATRLVSSGLRYLGDDVIPIDPRTRLAHPLPLTPAVRAETDGPVPLDAVRRLPKVDQPIEPAQVAASPAIPALLVFPAYTAGLATCDPIAPARAALELLQCTLSPRPHVEGALRAMTAIATDCAAVRLWFDDPGAATSTIERARRTARALSA